MTNVVETRSGWVRGVERRGKGLTSFLGIPFAEPPVGSLRFLAPQPVRSWQGVRDCLDYGPSAPQLVPQMDFIARMEVGPQSEDCLYLNVHTPGADREQRPVMVWIHGGAFTIGSGSQKMYEPLRIVQGSGFVVVTINYRLGALGFLGLGLTTAGATSNPGLLDQVAALEWVKANIAGFGGDPDRVTIFGESAGGMSVGTLLGMPSARGLFRGAIAMSGAAHSVATEEAAREAVASFCADAGVPADDLEALQRIPVEEILEAQERCEQRTRDRGGVLPYRPAVSPDSLPSPPIEAIAAGISVDVDVMAGCTRDEWNLFALLDGTRGQIDGDQLLTRVASRLGLAEGEKAKAAALIAGYRASSGGEQLSPLDLLSAIETDRTFRIPAIRLVEEQSRAGGSAWAYSFDWESPMLDGKLGACHGIDVPFVFGAVGGKAASAFAGEGKDAEALRDAVMQSFFAFTNKGDPNCHLLPDWPRYDEEERSTMIFETRSRVECDPKGARRELWKDLL